MADGWQTYPVEFRGGLVTNLSPIQQGINLPVVQDSLEILNHLLRVATEEF